MPRSNTLSRNLCRLDVVALSGTQVEEVVQETTRNPRLQALGNIIKFSVAEYNIY